MFARLVLFLALLTALPVSAAEIATQLVTARIHAENSVTAPGESVRLAFDMHIEPGWHTYWENSGDSGQPTELMWTTPEGVEISAIRFPVPHRQPFEPMMNYGYSDRSTLLMDAAIPAAWPAGKPVELNVEAFWLVCAEVCIPEQGETSFSIPTGPASTPDFGNASVFEAADADQPVTSPYAAVFSTAGESVQLRLDGEEFAAMDIEDAYFFPGEWGVIEHAAPQRLSRDAGGMTIAVKHSPETDGAFGGPRLKGVLTFESAAEGSPARTALSIDAGRGEIVAGVPLGAAGAGASYLGSGSASALTLPVAVLFAFLGGLILNLMPCVFPVLALKAIGFAGTAHEGFRERVSHGLAYTAGVVSLFLILAAAMIALKSAGGAVGWGFQLQEPWVVAALAFVMLIVGLNLSGVFEVKLGFEGAGEGLASKSGPAGAFFTGALAGIVATPCSAPFMASAMAAVLTMSAPATLLVFAALGLGLAAPFLLISLVPALSKMMPRPGAWMVRMKEALAFPMYATAAWLVWVLGSLAGQDAMLRALIAAVLIGFAAWIIGRLQEGGNWRMIGTGAAALAAVGALVLMSAVKMAPAGPSAGAAFAADGVGEPFTAARLGQLQAEGTPVFVNMTADWCITCKVNERVAFGDEFEAALERNGATYLKGDWTRRDPEITALLESFGRVGVPLYAVFPPEGAPSLLPQILTEGDLVRALDAAGQG